MKAHSAFERKVETLEFWVAAGGHPPGYELPAGVVALRRWQDPELGLSPWSSPNIVSRYPHLKARFHAAIAALQPTPSGLPTQGRSKMGADRARLTAQVERLREQVSLLLEDAAELRDQLQVARDTISRFKRSELSKGK